jgi:hypothetical protein
VVFVTVRLGGQIVNNLGRALDRTISHKIVDDFARDH